MPLLPEPGPKRTLAAATLIGTVGKGIFLTAAVLYFVRVVRLEPELVGLGLSVAGFVAVVSGILVGRAADRWGPRGAYVACLITGGASTGAFTLVGSFWVFLVLAAVATAAQSAGLVARGPIINRYGGARPQEFRAYIRSVTNVGIAAGAALAGWVATVDTRQAYVLVLLLNAACLVGSAAVMLRVPAIRPEPKADGPTWTALRDLPYLAVSLLDGVLSIQYRVLTVAIPLWVVTATTAPRWVISAIVVLNTAIVVLFQVRAARNVDTPAEGGRTMRRAGFALLAACVVIAWSAGAPTWAAVALLLVAAVIHTIGELWQAAGGFELSFALAPTRAQGQYLGVFGIGMALAESTGPALLTALCIGWGAPGWLVVGALFAAAGLVTPFVVAWAERTRDRYTRIATTEEKLPSSPRLGTGTPLS